MDSFDYITEARPRREIGLSLPQGIYGLKYCYVNQANRPARIERIVGDRPGGLRVVKKVGERARIPSCGDTLCNY
jgi:hypothetical protein